MNWYKFDTYLPNIGLELWTDATIWLNDINKKPNWIETPVKFSEIFVKRNKKTLLIVVGESWAYGETLPNIATALNQYSLLTQLSLGLGSRMALMLDADLYQYAVPGNCNMYMFSELERMLSHASTFDYDKIYVSVQMTEPGREMAISNIIEDTGHPLSALYNRNQQYEIQDWLRSYDEIFFDIYHNTLQKFNLNMDATLWKNFCRTVTPKRNYAFKIEETSWIQYSGKVLSRNVEMPDFYSIGWFARFQEEYNVAVDIGYANSQLNIINECNDFIKTNALHNNHPNQYGHLLWAQYLCRSAGWRNDL